MAFNVTVTDGAVSLGEVKSARFAEKMPVSRYCALLRKLSKPGITLSGPVPSIENLALGELGFVVIREVVIGRDCGL
jgi:hypothetical protein